MSLPMLLADLAKRGPGRISPVSRPPQTLHATLNESFSTTSPRHDGGGRTLKSTKRSAPPTPLEYTPSKNAQDQRSNAGNATSFGFAPGVKIPTSPFANSQGKGVKRPPKTIRTPQSREEGKGGFRKKGISYKSASRRITAIMVAVPIFIAMSAHLWRRLVVGEERKFLVSEEDRSRIREANRLYMEAQVESRR